jgi:hypothetical protein
LYRVGFRPFRTSWLKVGTNILKSGNSELHPPAQNGRKPHFTSKNKLGAPNRAYNAGSRNFSAAIEYCQKADIALFTSLEPRG